MPKHSEKTAQHYFSTDMYKKISTKQKEKQKRGHGPAHRIQGKKQRPENLKLFLTNSENKLRLFNVLKETWQSDECAPHLKNRKVIIACEDKSPELSEAFLLSNNVGTKTQYESKDCLS